MAILKIKMPVGSHIIPKKYLQQFATVTPPKQNGTVWVYRKGGAPQSIGTPVVGVENGYFDFELPSGEIEKGYEEKLAAEEGCAHGFLPQVGYRCFHFDTRRKEQMAVYIGILYARSRFRRRATAWLAGKTADDYRKVADDLEFVRDYAEVASMVSGLKITADRARAAILAEMEKAVDPATVKRNFVERLFRNANFFRDRVLERPWQIWKSTEREFITSDTPVCNVCQINNAFAPGFGFNHPGALILFPVSPDACLVIGKDGKDYKDVDSTTVEEVNRALICMLSVEAYSRTRDEAIEQQVNEYGGSSEPGVTAFIPPNVDYLSKAKQLLIDSVLEEIDL